MLHSFNWRYIRGDAETFVSEFILCLLSKTGSNIPLPLASTLHGERPNQVFHFDYHFLRCSDTDHIYALEFNGDIIGHCLSQPSGYAMADNTSMVLTRWMRTFSPPPFWDSD